MARGDPLDDFLGHPSGGGQSVLVRMDKEAGDTGYVGLYVEVDDQMVFEGQVSEVIMDGLGDVFLSAIMTGPI